jgi:hypothetical protein
VKTAAIFVVCGAVAFLGMGYQMGLFEEPAPRDEAAVRAVEEAAAAPRPKFPEDLAPACSGKAVAQAAAYQPGAEPHPLVFFDAAGKLNSDWQERLNSGWQADTVESTELVVFLSQDKKAAPNPQQVSDVTGAGASGQAVDVRVVEARTGKVLANRLFQPVTRQRTGPAVSFTAVFNWVSAQAQAGFTKDTAVARKTNNRPRASKLPAAEAPERTKETPVKLLGTQWVGSEDLTGYDRLRFSFVSSTQVVMYDAKETVPGTWTLTGSSITMRFFDGSVVYEGNVYGDGMSGNGDNGGDRWFWRVTQDNSDLPVPGTPSASPGRAR